MAWITGPESSVVNGGSEVSATCEMMPTVECRGGRWTFFANGGCRRQLTCLQQMGLASL